MTLVELLGKREVWVTGKGGVGKTTATAALALNYAQKGDWVLAFDVDGYHSLPDAFNVPAEEGRRFRIPENSPQTLFHELGVDLDLCLVSPNRIVDAVRAQRESSKSDRTKGMPHYFGILHFYDVLEQLGAFVANEDLAALCLITAERMEHKSKTEGRDSDGDRRQPGRILYDNQSSNATVSLLRRANAAVERLGDMKEHQFVWKAKATIAGWPDMRAFVGEDYIKHVERYIDAFADLNVAIRDEKQSAFLIVTGARSTELTETSRLIDELQESGFPVTATLVNKYRGDVDRGSVSGFKGRYENIPLFVAPDLAVF